MVTLKRSILYIPGDNARAIEKARGLDADALILDLEDGVAAEKKAEARAIVKRALGEGGFGKREVAVRINDPASPWYAEDIALARAIPCSAVLLPKMETADSVRQVRQDLGEEKYLWVMIETPEGVLNAFEIATADSRLSCFIVGTNDLRVEMALAEAPDRLGLQTSLSLVVLAARAARIAVVDGVFNDISDGQGFRTECLQGRQLGFDGKTVIHPSQINPANAAFSPSATEVEEARDLIEVFECASGEGKSVATFRGRMIEDLDARRARRLLEMADAVARPKD